MTRAGLVLAMVVLALLAGAPAGPSRAAEPDTPVAEPDTPAAEPETLAAEPEALEGIALVIGNADYESLPALANPGNDARAIEAMLADLGFDTALRTDRTGKRLERDLERFLEDAEEADVALLYYAGHGVEAGGENFLVPVDAGAAPARGDLVSINEAIETLRRTVPVAIVLLDACRDNPFPPGALIETQDGGKAPIAVAGLAPPARGVMSLAGDDRPPEVENVATVLGFAAEPGAAAEDGEGGNSPYAAALLRHVETMAGEEFGTVMRLVTEEVYLDTQGRQRPWMNASLRRLIYLGERPEAEAGDEEAVLGERRGLLLHVAALPDPERRRAERLAERGRVPVSVAFALMREIGVDPADDPATTEARLADQIARFRADREARRALENPDAEVQRLSMLADAAELEGAFTTANGFRERAKLRVASLRPSRDEQIALLTDRIREDAEVFARSAQTKELLFDYGAAAADYAEAAGMVARWDDAAALRYRLESADARLMHARTGGEVAAMLAVEEAARDGLGAPGLPDAARAEFAVLLAESALLRMRTMRDVGAVEALLAEAADALEPVVGRDMSGMASEAAALRARGLTAQGRVLGGLAYLRRDRAAEATALATLERGAQAARALAEPARIAEARLAKMRAAYNFWTLRPDDGLATLAVMAEMAGFASAFEGVGDDTGVEAAGMAANLLPIAEDLAFRRGTASDIVGMTQLIGFMREGFGIERFPRYAAQFDVTTAALTLSLALNANDPSGIPASLAPLEGAVALLERGEGAEGAERARMLRAQLLAELAYRGGDAEALRKARRTVEGLRPDAFAGLAGWYRDWLDGMDALARGDLDAARSRHAGMAAWLGPDKAVTQSPLALRQARLAMILSTATGDAVLARAAAALVDPLVEAAADRDWRSSWPGFHLDVLEADGAAALIVAEAAREPAALREALAAQHAHLEAIQARAADAPEGERAALLDMTVSASLRAAWLTAFQRRVVPPDAAWPPEEIDRARALLATIEPHVSEALRPYYASTLCQVETAQARAGGDVALAGAALERCRDADRTLRASGDAWAARLSAEAVEDAGAAARALGAQ